MAEELIRPIDENTAKALEESAKALGKGLDLMSGFGTFIADLQYICNASNNE